MTISQNQFAQATAQGVMDMKFSPNILSAQIDTSSAGSLLAGQSVKLVDSASGIPKVVECAADSDDVFGFLIYDMRRASYAVGDKVELAFFRGSVMYMTASAAIARGAKVMVVIASKKVATATVGKTVVGRALDKAAADGDLIRVIVDVPAPVLEFVQAADVAANATAAATDLASAEALANSLQTTVNAILASIKAAGLMA